MPDLALFDFDGTLTDSESFPAFVRLVVPRWRLLAGTVLLAPLIVGYRRGWVSGITVRAAIVRVGLAGLPVQAFDDAAARYAETVLPATLRPAAMAQLMAHRDRGDTVLIVSGTFDALLMPWGKSLGVPVLASTLECRDGRLTGRYAGAQCVAEEKARRVGAAVDITAFDRIHAYGDTPEDAALLALAHVRHYRGQRLDAGQPLPP